MSSVSSPSPLRSAHFKAKLTSDNALPSSNSIQTHSRRHPNPIASPPSGLTAGTDGFSSSALDLAKEGGGETVSASEVDRHLPLPCQAPDSRRTGLDSVCRPELRDVVHRRLVEKVLGPYGAGTRERKREATSGARGEGRAGRAGRRYVGTLGVRDAEVVRSFGTFDVGGERGKNKKNKVTASFEVHGGRGALCARKKITFTLSYSRLSPRGKGRRLFLPVLLLISRPSSSP